MYDKLKKNALKYYNPDGEFIEYRFKKDEVIQLIKELEIHKEIL